MSEKYNSKEKLPISRQELLRSQSKISYSINVSDDLIIPFKGYFSLFPRYCLIIKEFNVDFKVIELKDSLKFEFGYAVNNSGELSELSSYLIEFITLLKEKNIYLRLRNKIKNKTVRDNNLFNKFSLRLEEEINHLNRVIYLEIGLKTILELPERSTVNMKVDEELFKLKETAKQQYEDYRELVKYIESEKDKEKEFLLQNNKRLKEELEKVDLERQRLLDKVLNNNEAKLKEFDKAINNKVSKDHLIELITQNKIDEIFELLKHIKNDKIFEEVILLQNRWSENEENKILDLESYDKLLTEKQKIIRGLIRIIRRL